MNVNFMMMSMDVPLSNTNLQVPFNLPFGIPFLLNPNHQQNPNSGIWNQVFSMQNGPNPNGNQFRNIHDIMDQMFQQHNSRGTPPASTNYVDKLPRIIVDEKLVEEKLECSVCKDNFQFNDNALQLPCSHLYHQDCIEPWLKQHCSCPVCRYELPVDDEEYDKERKKRMSNRNVNEDLNFCKNEETTENFTRINEEAEKLAQEFLESEEICEMGKIKQDKCVLLNSSEYVALGCGHSFHKECLESSLRILGQLQNNSLTTLSNFFCPVCKEQTCILNEPEIDY